MADPILEQCVAAIAAAVATVVTPTYTTNISRVLRFNKDPESEIVDTYACVVTRNNRALGKILTGKTRHKAVCEIYVYDLLDQEAEDGDKRLTQAYSDVVTAVEAAITPGESAIFDRLDYLEHEQLTKMDEQRPIGGVRIDYEFQYLCPTGDPTAGR